MTKAAVTALCPNTEGYFGTSPLMIFPSALGKFSVYLRQGEEYVLYTSADETFTERHRKILYANGVDAIFIRLEHRELYNRYIEDNLGTILLNQDLPLTERAGVFYKASSAILEEMFEEHLPNGLDNVMFSRIQKFVDHAVKFLCLENSLKAVAEFIAHDYKTYTHCVNVFVYTVALLKTYDFDEELLTHCGLGAMLHDIGKSRIPTAILNKPGGLSPEERRIINQHPTLGLASCTLMPLSQDALNIIMFHHEKIDGSGYPAGIMGDEIPLYVKAATIADIYDALTTKRSYANARRPYEALEIMGNSMKNELDLNIVKRFILMLSEAELQK